MSSPAISLRQMRRKVVKSWLPRICAAVMHRRGIEGATIHARPRSRGRSRNALRLTMRRDSCGRWPKRACEVRGADRSRPEPRSASASDMIVDRLAQALGGDLLRYRHGPLGQKGMDAGIGAPAPSTTTVSPVVRNIAPSIACWMLVGLPLAQPENGPPSYSRVSLKRVTPALCLLGGEAAQQEVVDRHRLCPRAAP